MFKSVIILVVILVLLFTIISGYLFYIVIKKAVKNGVLEALYEYNAEDDFEE